MDQKLILCALAVMTSIVACDDGSQRSAANTASMLEVSAGTFEGTWPLTVPAGVLVCEQRTAPVVTLKAGEVTYALNEEAERLANARDWRPGRFIRRLNPENDHEELSLEPLIRLGESLCDEDAK